MVCVHWAHVLAIFPPQRSTAAQNGLCAEAMASTTFTAPKQHHVICMNEP